VVSDVSLILGVQPILLIALHLIPASGTGLMNIHDIVNTAQLIHASCHCCLQVCDTSNVHAADTDDFGARTNAGDFGCYSFGFGGVAADDAGVRT